MKSQEGIGGQCGKSGSVRILIINSDPDPIIGERNSVIKKFKKVMNIGEKRHLV